MIYVDGSLRVTRRHVEELSSSAQPLQPHAWGKPVVRALGARALSLVDSDCPGSVMACA